MRNDEDFMRLCLELGRVALIAGDAPVGSLIVIGDEIIAEGVESVKSKHDPTAHAEIEAVRLACEKLNSLDLRGATLYTNVEPCVMCAFAIRQTGIGTVIFGLSLDQVGGANSKFPVLTDSDFPLKYAPPEILSGVLLGECENLHREFRELRKIKNKIE
jgi:tRNA(adenine34) deaminase